MSHRRPQLDGLRGFAVAAVIVHHYFFHGAGPLGNAGVKLFFVLSGFLITSILLAARHRIDEGESTVRSAFGQFYLRRAIRIFPLYYAVLVAAVLLGLAPARELAPWLGSYTLNFHMMSVGWYVDRFAHFWTLAVEEQFYLIWPAVILAAPRRLLLPITAGCIVLGPLWRTYAAFSNPLGSYISPLACLDTLGFGALLAVALHDTTAAPMLGRLCSSGALLASGSGLLMVLWLNSAPYNVTLFDVGLALLFCGLTRMAYEGAPGPLGRIFDFRPLGYIGQLGYGIYVFHPFVLEGTRAASARLAIDGIEGSVVACFATLLTVAAAAVSWHAFERPINELRNRARWANVGAAAMRLSKRLGPLSSPGS